MIQPIRKEDIITRLKLEVDTHLTTLSQAIKEGNQEKIDAVKEELATIHNTFVALGYYETPVKKVEVPEPVEA